MVPAELAKPTAAARVRTHHQPASARLPVMLNPAAGATRARMQKKQDDFQGHIDPHMAGGDGTRFRTIQRKSGNPRNTDKAEVSLGAIGHVLHDLRALVLKRCVVSEKAGVSLVTSPKWAMTKKNPAPSC